VPSRAYGVARYAAAVRALVLSALVVTILGPALLPGYTLIRDQVFVPDQSLLPWMLGLGGGLPRSVPQDAVVALVSGPVPGWLLEKAALVAALALLGSGVSRLLRPAGTGARIVGTCVAVWSAFVVERLLMGHWTLLLAVGVLPWLVDVARRARSGERGTWAAWALWLLLASLTVTGGLLALAVSLPVAVGPRSRLSPVRRWAWAASGLIAQLPWLVPALVVGSAAAPQAASGAEVFHLRAENGLGAVITALGTGGIWNAEAVPGSRTTILAPLATVVLLLLAAFGARRTVLVLGRAASLTLASLALAGVAWNLAGSVEQLASAVEWAVGTLPGGGVLRDAQKWLAPWLLLLAVSSALGADRVARDLVARTDRPTARTLLVGVALVPVLCLPDAAWGVTGQLAAVDYPADYATVRDRLAAAGPGDAISLPWQSLRRFPWNDGRSVLDPVPRAMTRTVVASDTLVVRAHGELVTLSGEDPSAARVSAAIATHEPLGPVLADLGVGWAVVATDVPGATDDLPPDAVLVSPGEHLALYRLAPAAPRAVPDGTTAVLLADLVTACLLVAAAAVGIGTVTARHVTAGE